MNEKLDALIEQQQPALIKSLQEIIRIPSKPGPAQPGMPFGEGPAKALDYALALCQSLGFRTKNIDGYIGYAEIGEGEQMLGILTHLDVVPEGTGWTYPPYGAEIADGKLYGRGTMDDKGPAISCIYAVKAVAEAGIPLHKRIRIIFGTDEEKNWYDIDHYKETNQEIPTVSFVPDGNFPLIFAEKGCVTIDFSIDAEKAGLLELTGGTASNAVPDFCSAKLLTKSGDVLELQASGVAAHASLPHLGENAISKLMEQLYEMDEAGEITCALARFYHEKIGMGIYGEKMDLDISDESGRLTMNIGTARTKDGVITMQMDIRHPISWTCETIRDLVQSQLEPYGIRVTDISIARALFMDLKSELVTTLLGVYREITGDLESKPLAIGGGSYARAIPNAIGFGPVLPGRPWLAHQKDEHVRLDDLHTMTRIYAHAIAALVG